jgi:hypothetical protein
MVDASEYKVPADIGRWRGLALGIGGICTIIILAVALLFREEALETALRAWLLGFMFAAGIGIGGLGILHLQYLTGGAWGVVIRRIVEACSRTVPVLAILFIPIAAGVYNLYEWSHINKTDPIVMHRGWYLTWSGFIVRAVIYFALWWVMQYLLNKWSAQQDASADYEESARFLGSATAFSGPSLVIFVLLVSFATIDWTMTLDPHWFSTIWGFLYVAGWALSCFAFVVAILAYLSDKAPMDRILGKRHFHDIGKLMLALVMVWAYFNFSQFLIIWSGNIPEETPWYLKRMKDGWGWIGLILIIFHFAVPYLILLSRDIKRNAKWLALIAVFILVMRVVDMFYHIAPSVSVTGTYPKFNAFWLLYLIGPLAVGGIWLWAFFGELMKRPLVPVKDPFLENAIEHGRGH